MMIRRARSALPGVVVSMFLVTPTLATPAAANEIPVAGAHRRPHQTRTARHHDASPRSGRVRVAHALPVHTTTQPSYAQTIAFLDDDAPPVACDRAGTDRTGTDRTGTDRTCVHRPWPGRPDRHGILTAASDGRAN